MLVQRGYESDPVKAWKEAQEKVIICRMRHSEKLLKATSKANQKPNPWILNLVLLTVLSGVFGDWSLLFIHETDMIQEFAVTPAAKHVASVALPGPGLWLQVWGGS